MKTDFVRRLPLLLALLLALLATRPAEAIDGRRLLKDLGDDYRDAAAWELRFEHVFVWTLAGDTTVTEGRLLVTPDGAFALELGPARMLSDGRSIWRWEEGGLQVLEEAAGTGDDVILPHQLLLQPEERFKAGEVVSEGKDALRLGLEPKGDSEFMQAAVLHLVKEGRHWRPQALGFEDIGGNRHLYRVLEREALPVIDEAHAERLRFKLPAGMELIDLRGGAESGPAAEEQDEAR